VAGMPAASATTPTITPEFVARLAELAPTGRGVPTGEGDTSRELAAALTLGMKVSWTAMV
ncbi:MAG: hypothetical protein QOI29_3873, partial [Mycobacterium sp.]|nr:hypothetical protein [Mycobacterium sp.]